MGLALLHAFVGWSTVSPFCKIGKATFWPVWLAKVKPGDTTLSIIFKKFCKLPMNI